MGRLVNSNGDFKGSVYKEIPRAFHHVPLDNPDATVAAIAEFVEQNRIGAE